MDLNQNQTQEKTDIYNEEDGCKVKAIPFTINPALPELFGPHIEHLLHLMAHIYEDGHELDHIIGVAIDRNGQAHLLDGKGCPHPILYGMWANKYLTEHDCAAMLVATEGYELPEEEAQKWIKGERPAGVNEVKDHPLAFESLRLSVETLNGLWTGSVRLDPANTIDLPEGAQLPERIVHGTLELTKVDETESGGPLVNLLPANRQKMYEQIPEEIREKIGSVVSALGKTLREARDKSNDTDSKPDNSSINTDEDDQSKPE